MVQERILVEGHRHCALSDFGSEAPSCHGSSSDLREGSPVGRSNAWVACGPSHHNKVLWHGTAAPVRLASWAIISRKTTQRQSLAPPSLGEGGRSCVCQSYAVGDQSSAAPELRPCTNRSYPVPHCRPPGFLYQRGLRRHDQKQPDHHGFHEKKCGPAA